MSKSDSAPALATEALRQVELLGNTIERLVTLGCLVSLEVHYNEGQESMILPALTGEFRLQAGRYESLTDQIGD